MTKPLALSFVELQLHTTSKVIELANHLNLSLDQLKKTHLIKIALLDAFQNGLETARTIYSQSDQELLEKFR